MVVLTILGTRPQLIKSQMVSRELKKMKIKEKIINTMQHYDKNLNQYFYNKDNNIIPLFKKKILDNSITIKKLLIQIKKIKPNLIIVYGDTNSTLYGAISANLLSIKLMHIEAGLRSKNQKMPEEKNRIIVDTLANYHICPTHESSRNLLSEGHLKKNIYILGDPSYDIFLYQKKNLIKKTLINKKFNQHINNFALLTLHRNTNVDSKKKLSLIFKFLEKTKFNFILPLHPRTRKNILKYKIPVPLNIKIFDPVNHIELLSLIKFSKFVITDSGGVQRESYFSSKKCYLLRDDYEWVDLVKFKQSIIITSKSLNNNFLFNTKPIKYKKNLLGNGKASFKIAKLIKEILGDKKVSV